MINLNINIRYFEREIPINMNSNKLIFLTKMFETLNINGLSYGNCKKILISFGGSLLFNFKMMNVNAGPGGKVVYTREQTSKFFFPRI